MFAITTHRPRNVDARRAAAILYGDLGTSKAYVIGLAVAMAGYSAFWFIAAVSLLALLIGVSYISVCRHYPNGGGVYASVRNRSRIISMIGAFFLVADYLVTAALSALSAFSYLGVSDPVLFASLAILVIGFLNYYGPRRAGTFAFGIFICAVVILTLLAIACLPFLKTAWHHIEAPKGDAWDIWKQFVTVIVALSGVEAIANATGVMKLNRGATHERPVVTQTSTPAIIWVLVEVIIYTSLFGFAVAAISGFELVGGTVNAPGHPDVRDYMLRYMGEVFGGTLISPAFGKWFGIVISGVIGVILLSAVNTAINGLVALQYVMSSDDELPSQFRKVNRYGVPIIPLILSAVIPVILIIAMKDVAKLASLYAIGFVGAIATNLGSTSTDFGLRLKKWERSLMFFAFLIMAAIEITLFIDKPHARNYAIIVMAAGLLLRWVAMKIKERAPAPLVTPHEKIEIPKAPAILCATNRTGKALTKALEYANTRGYTLHLLFPREQKVITEKDLKKKWETDSSAVKVYQFANEHIKPGHLFFYYSITDSWQDMVVAYAMRLEVEQIIIDAPRKNKLLRALQGNRALEVAKILPPNILLSIAK